MPVSIHKTREQLRAGEAYKFATDAKKQLKDKFDDYASLVKKLPAMIQTNGLGQTLAFLVAKAGIEKNKVKEDKSEGLLYNQLQAWLIRGSEEESSSRGPYWRSEEEEKKEKERDKDEQAALLLYRVIHGDVWRYRQGTREALAFVTWLKSFAEALQKGSKKEGQ